MGTNIIQGVNEAAGSVWPREDAEWDLLKMYKYLIKREKEDGDKLLSMVP